MQHNELVQNLPCWRKSGRGPDAWRGWKHCAGVRTKSAGRCRRHRSSRNRWRRRRNRPYRQHLLSNWNDETFKLGQFWEWFLTHRESDTHEALAVVVRHVQCSSVAVIVVQTDSVEHNVITWLDHSEASIRAVADEVISPAGRSRRELLDHVPTSQKLFQNVNNWNVNNWVRIDLNWRNHC